MRCTYYRLACGGACVSWGGRSGDVLGRDTVNSGLDDGDAEVGADGDGGRGAAFGEVMGDFAVEAQAGGTARGAGSSAAAKPFIGLAFVIAVAVGVKNALVIVAGGPPVGVSGELFKAGLGMGGVMLALVTRAAQSLGPHRATALRRGAQLRGRHVRGRRQGTGASERRRVPDGAWGWGKSFMQMAQR